ncbi:MAG: hypothetical protein R3E64_01785 [Halioglobus sp.]
MAVVTFVWAGYASAVPITDTVTVEGLEWAQVDLFKGLSWSSINVVCPAGVCGSGTLSGYDMAGWSWATVDDMNKLFNHYIGFEALGPGPSFWWPPGSDFTASTAFFGDGWRQTGYFFGEFTEGLVSDYDAGAPVMGRVTEFGVPGDRISTDDKNIGGTLDRLFVGAWFFREEENNTVSSPATLTLTALGLSALGFSRRKRLRS